MKYWECNKCGVRYEGLSNSHICVELVSSRIKVSPDHIDFKVEDHYKKDDGTDTIDKWALRYRDDPDKFREVMWCLMEKYKDRLGKKDSIKKEVGKIADYAARWAAFEAEQ